MSVPSHQGLDGFSPVERAPWVAKNPTGTPSLLQLSQLFWTGAAMSLFGCLLWEVTASF